MPAEIDIGLLREEEALTAGAVAKLNFSEFGAVVYRRFLLSYQGLTAVLLIYGFFFLLFQPSSLLVRVVFVSIAFGLHAGYLFVRQFYLDTDLAHPDLYKVWRYWTLPNSRFVVARDLSRGGRIVGTVTIRRRSGSESTVGEVSRLRVIEGYEGEGIARILNDEAERLAKEELKCHKIVVLIFPDIFPKSLSLYERRGYKFVRNRKGGGYYPGLFWDEIHLEKFLT